VVRVFTIAIVLVCASCEMEPSKATEPAPAAAPASPELRAARACREECVQDGVRGQRVGTFACGAETDGSMACPTMYRELDVIAPKHACAAGWQPQTHCQYPHAPLCHAPRGQCCIEQGGVTEIVTPTGAMGNTLCGPDWDGWCRSICICLARSTRIATPAGEVAITELRAGMIVYSRDRDGQRIAVPVLATHEAHVPADHRVVHLELADGRTVDVSPGHPDPSGRRVGELAPGDAFDGTTIAVATLISYTGGSTFDLLPASETGVYWANGIPLGSTLHGKIGP
jgi:hypothetical protein